jgi:hypothetical protein
MGIKGCSKEEWVSEAPRYKIYSTLQHTKQNFTSELLLPHDIYEEFLNPSRI